MGTIKSTNDQVLSSRVSNQYKGKKKSKDLKQQEKKKQDKPKSSNGGSNPSKDKEKKKQEKKICTYCHRGWNPESVCMKITIYMMAQLLDKNNTPDLKGAGKKYGGSNSENKDSCHALIVGSYSSSSFIIDLGASRNMNYTQDSFSSLHPYNGPSILMVMTLRSIPKGFV